MDSFTHWPAANICNPRVNPCGALWPVVGRHKLQSPRVDLPDSDGARQSSAFLVPLPAYSCPFCSQLSATVFRFLSCLLTSPCKVAVSVVLTCCLVFPGKARVCLPERMFGQLRSGTRHSAVGLRTVSEPTVYI